MKQWIIDRYNKGQEKYTIEQCGSEIRICRCSVFFVVLPTILDLYDFLFNPEWGFAKAFWGDEYKMIFVGPGIAKSNEKLYEYHLQQMVIAPDSLEYLEQFKMV